MKYQHLWANGMPFLICVLLSTMLHSAPAEAVPAYACEVAKTSCLNEGFYRHCVLTCMLKKVLSTGFQSSMAANLGAMCGALISGKDVPLIFDDWDYEDILSNLEGIYQSYDRSDSCLTGCRKRYHSEIDKRCCPHNILVKKTNAKCCKPK